MSAPETDTHPTDARLRRAADDLRRQVEAEVDSDAALARVTSTRRPVRSGRAPWLVAAAAAIALVVAGAAFVAARDTPEEVTVDDRRPTTPDPQAPPPTAMGAPDDGRASLDLPVTATPSTDLTPGDTVTLAGEGFNPGQAVGVVQCTMDVVESSAGSAACDLGVLGTSGTADTEGRVTGSIEVRRVITTDAGKVDCTAPGARCGVAIGQITDYDVSGAAEITFVDGLPPLVRPTLTVSPSTGLAHGDTVTVTVDGLTGPLEIVHLCPVTATPPLAGVPQIRPTTSEAGDRCWYGIQGNAVLPAPDADGRVTIDLQVWRAYSPSQSGGVVDCAVEQCALLAYGGAELDAEPAIIEFDPDGPMPPQAVLSAEPMTDLHAGDAVEVTVSGLASGTAFSVSACGAPSWSDTVRDGCGAAVPLAEGKAGTDGTWTGTVTLPDPSSYGVDCSVEGACALSLSAASTDQGQPNVSFLPPEPVPIVVAPG